MSTIYAQTEQKHPKLQYVIVFLVNISYPLLVLFNVYLSNKSLLVILNLIFPIFSKE
ncbi:hypothetical protein VIBNISFn27_870046 [Vibrio nigripulchritudo SFn27]|uniref:Uncharacterized protein n=1 Tax=Vibrio nigripulchritudo TaxID=28173 RepID=U4K293_9VIBR|nr:hypothetical protein VIBNIBLFn1_960046 [Vibrio nigripulchritudo BLFn1]CCN91074.1 hypothetical protein VIBNISFn27_870046 [Vibrio nigripulchritudo SFn27]CCN93552.1 hypothetical protein VIBNIENn2_240024 [Vibrio nigripulchritudo ENn2]CCO40081.1 hypothetical protein VIBNISFn135_220047 [Vibrio nigripulchritudo SFn135]CCO54153.1 hypothetical protein VIBNIWn13_640046 [Vibrio nigripulchritudo Wn13]CCO59381.1 hypothetical protein VIBNI_A3392 [Vibrio nigripulchritudo]